MWADTEGSTRCTGMLCRRSLWGDRGWKIPLADRFHTFFNPFSLSHLASACPPLHHLFPVKICNWQPKYFGKILSKPSLVNVKCKLIPIQWIVSIVCLSRLLFCCLQRYWCCIKCNFEISREILILLLLLLLPRTLCISLFPFCITHYNTTTLPHYKTITLYHYHTKTLLHYTTTTRKH